MKLPKFLGGTPAADEASAEASRRRRRRPRPDAPRTIIPVDERPSWLPADAPAAPAAPAPGTPARPASLAVDLDAARDRLRREIPPVDDDLGA